MKARNLNNSSVKTRNLIRKTFAEMLYEKKEIDKISVTELVKRADINRGTFYSHYDDIYSVAEDYENELMEKFFDNASLLSTNFEQFIDSVFKYLEENDETYKLLCGSNETLAFTRKLTLLVENKLYLLCISNSKIVNRDYLELEINIFVEGLLSQYFKYCRGISEVTLDDLHHYINLWYHNFVSRRYDKQQTDSNDTFKI